MAQAGCHQPLRRKPARGPQHQVKPAASTELPPESRIDHFAVKAMSAMPQSGGARVAGLGGVEGAARVHGEERNTRGPSAQPGSGRRASYKPMAKSSRAQRESGGIVGLLTAATNNAVRVKGPCFGRARNEGKCQGMAGKTGSNHPDTPLRVVNARQPWPELETSAKRRSGTRSWLRCDIRGLLHAPNPRGVHAASGRPSVSRVPEIGTHGLKGGPALSPMTIIV